jgi:hypothetical protein
MSFDSDGKIEIFMFIAGFVMGVVLAVILSGESFRKDAISRGVARYNPNTANWEWTVDKLPELEEGNRIIGDPK